MAINTLGKRIQFKESIPISKFRFWIGFLVSILLSFFLYQFFIFGRDLLRLFTFTNNFNYLEFTENELLFYNLFYALLSLIIVQSFFLKNIFDTHKNFGEKRIQFKRKKIVHDQNVLIWMFLYWFLKLCFFYGIMNMNSLFWYSSSFSIYEHISFFEEFPYLFVLILLVLFLQSWQSLGLTLRNYFKYLVTSFALISVLGFGFTKINLVDFESFFKKQHAENPYIRENIQLPSTSFTELLSPWDKKIEVFILKSDEIIVFNQKTNLSGLKGVLLEINKENYRSNYDAFIQLNVDKNIPLEQLYKTKEIIRHYTDFKIAYATYPNKLKLSKSYYQDRSEGLFDGDKNVSFKNEIIVQLTKGNEILVNNNTINCNEIIKTIALNILKNKNYTLKVKLKEDAVFSDYIKILSYTREGYLKACKVVAGEKNIDNYTLYNNPESILHFNVLYIIESENNFLQFPSEHLEYE